MPNSLSKVEKYNILRIVEVPISKFPEELSNLKRLIIDFRKLNNISLNFDALPKKIPNLKIISIYKASILDFLSFPTETPSLTSFNFYNCRIRSLKGIPHNLKTITFKDCIIDSFDGLNPNSLKNQDLSKSIINFEGYTFSSLSISSLQGLPYNLIRKIEIFDSEIINLKRMPEELSNLISLEINGRALNSSIPVPLNFVSFKGLPENLPSLKCIGLNDASLPNLESLPSKTPLLSELSFKNCHFGSLKGVPNTLKSISFYNGSIDSFEGLEVNNHNILDPTFPRLYMNNCKFSSLSGISITTLKSILIEYFSDFGPTKRLANLTIKGMQLLNDCIDQEILDQYHPLKLLRKAYSSLSDYIFEKRFGYRQDLFDLPKKPTLKKLYPNLNNDDFTKWFGYQCVFPSGIDFSNIIPSQLNWNHKKDADITPEMWIYGFDLEDSLFIPEKISLIQDFYQKKTIELAHQYISNPSSLTSDEIERLIQESDYKILNFLESQSNLPHNDLIIAQIAKKFTEKTKKNYILLK